MSYSYDVIFENNPRSTLQGSISPTDTTAVLANGTGIKFPVLGANQAFTLTLIDSATGLLNEIVLVTGFNNTTATITSMLRGQENTTAQSWNAGDIVANLITAEYLNGLLQDQQALNGFLPVSGGTMTGAINYAQPVILASASTVNIGAAASNIIIITGTTTINSFGTIASGATRSIRFTGALTLTNSTSLFLPNNGLNITTASGDSAVFVSLGSGNWKCISYTRANGQALQYVSQIQSDYAQSSPLELDYIKNKPNLATVATSGSYADLSNKPTIPPNNSVFAPNALWNNVTASRVSGAIYTNTTGYTIAISATSTPANSAPFIEGYVNGILVSKFKWQANGVIAEAGCFLIVPDGATYQLVFISALIANWVELY